MEKLKKLTKDLPDEQAALRFYGSLSEQHPAIAKRLEKSEGLFSDVLTIAAFSPLLSTTILQNPNYISWLKRARKFAAIRDKEGLRESLARFALTNSSLETGVLLARFRRRELIRVYLKDIRGLGSIAEITEEISILADVILEYALEISRQELDNRYGIPLASDEKEKQIHAGFCVCALGKLGSKELNYSSDIDLLFLYSHEGETSGHGAKGATTNREYFIKLAEHVTKLVGTQTGEGAAYRVDMRLRPHGRVGRLAISVNEAIRYFKEEAQMWERQVLIRSRASAGDLSLYDDFFAQVEPKVFSAELTAREALLNVRLSKEKINAEEVGSKGFDTKLGRGGIREIEFIAQALQLAYGGSDKWLRSSHTLISLARLADRGLITDSELTNLFEAYTFLRRLEHRLQMEHGLQTHSVPDNLEKRLLISQRMGIHFVADFNAQLVNHTDNVSDVFTRIFGDRETLDDPIALRSKSLDARKPEDRELGRIFTSLEKSDAAEIHALGDFDGLQIISREAPPLARMIAANPNLVETLPHPGEEFKETDLKTGFYEPVMAEPTFAARLAEMRKIKSRIISRIAAHDAYREIDLETSRSAQTRLAETAIETAAAVAKNELARFYGHSFAGFPLAALGLGKLGGGGMDLGSDLDLVMVFDDEVSCPVPSVTKAEFYAKGVEYFVTALSSMTRDGSLYRVDLRLRPDGKNGATACGLGTFVSYFNERAAVWEWLAYVKLRGVTGENGLAEKAEHAARSTIHTAAERHDPDDLRIKSHEMRLRLQAKRSGKRKGNEINIKYGEGGLQDVYFAIRYLQLRDNIPDDDQNRSTLNSLSKLRDLGSLPTADYLSLKHGYTFLRLLDHNLRLNSGRSNRVFAEDPESVRVVAERLGFASPLELLSELTTHRLNIRDAFNSVFETGV